MAKLFPIGIEVEEVAVGSVLRLLNKTPGVAKLHLNLLNEGGQPQDETGNEGGTRPILNEVKQVMPPLRPAKSGSMGDVLAKVLAVSPVHHSILREALVRNGYSPNSLPSQLMKMVQDGLIKKVSQGTYRLTDRGFRHYGLAEKHKSTNQLALKEANNGHGVRKLVLTSLDNAPQLLARDLRKILRDSNYSPKNMTGTVGKMKNEGLITSDKGVYSITEQGRAALSGSAASTTETTVEN